MFLFSYKSGESQTWYKVYDSASSLFEMLPQELFSIF